VQCIHYLFSKIFFVIGYVSLTACICGVEYSATTGKLIGSLWKSKQKKLWDYGLQWLGAAQISSQPWASADIFPGGAESTICLSFSACWQCCANGLIQNALPFLDHKGNDQCYSNSCKQCFPSKKILHWAIVCFSEHEYFMTQSSEFRINYKLCELLE